jgi:flagellar basal-body rod protein FlgB
VLDFTMQAIQSSLDGLAARQRVISQNLANAETPGYTAQTVSFEENLRAALDSGDPSEFAIQTSLTTPATSWATTSTSTSRR